MGHAGKEFLVWNEHDFFFGTTQKMLRLSIPKRQDDPLFATDPKFDASGKHPPVQFLTSIQICLVHQHCKSKWISDSFDLLFIWYKNIKKKCFSVWTLTALILHYKNDLGKECFVQMLSGLTMQNEVHLLISRWDGFFWENLSRKIKKILQKSA